MRDWCESCVVNLCVRASSQSRLSCFCLPDEFEQGSACGTTLNEATAIMGSVPNVSRMPTTSAKRALAYMHLCVCIVLVHMALGAEVASAPFTVCFREVLFSKILTDVIFASQKLHRIFLALRRAMPTLCITIVCNLTPSTHRPIQC